MASDLISRKALVKAILAERDKIPLTVPAASYELVREKPNSHGNSMRGGIRKVLYCVETAPAVDAVEVVRCKDCVHAGAFPNNYAARRFEGRMNCYLCRGDDGYGISNVSVVYPDDFCSDGVRKEKKDAVD